MNSDQFCLRNGVLYKGREPKIALGVSYFASYHPLKVPVPECEDREKEVIRDLNRIRDAGFNIVRCAAIGDVMRINENDVKVSFPLIDFMLEKAEHYDLAFLVRLQGYDMILGDYDDGIMMNEKGEVMPEHWGWFVRNCVNHPKVIKDNQLGTKFSAQHFAEFRSVVGYQIYNEPAYPSRDVYCYNPHTIRRFKDMLLSKYGRAYDPPREKPSREHIRRWVEWRIFNADCLSQFLSTIGESAKEGDPHREIFTDLMPCPLTEHAALRGEDYYSVSEGMDFLGLTLYRLSNPKNTRWACMVLDAVESAAAVNGKKAWLIEYDAEVTLTGDDWQRQTYAALARGYKGILYYQWRADHPFKDSPEPELYGLVKSDGSETEKFPDVIRTNKLINKLSTKIARSARVRSGVGILYSSEVMAYYDALGVAGEPLQLMQDIYDSLFEMQIPVDFVRASDLQENLLGVQVLLLPTTVGLCEDNLRMIKEFALSGRKVIANSAEKSEFGNLSGHNIVFMERLETWASSTEGSRFTPVGLTGSENSNVDLRLLAGPDYLIVVVSNFGKEIRNGQLFLPPESSKHFDEHIHATFWDADTSLILECSLSDTGLIIYLPPKIHNGCLVVLERKKRCDNVAMKGE